MTEDGHINTQRPGTLYEQRKVSLDSVEVTVGHVNPLGSHDQHLLGGPLTM